MTAAPCSRQYLSEGKDADMGFAELSRPDICLAMQGKDCRICLDKCPIKETRPIIFQPGKRPDGLVYHEPKVQKSCVGCGKCEEECPTDLPAITIVPRRERRGVIA